MAFKKTTSVEGVKKKNFFTLMVRMKIGIATMENNMKFPQKNRPTI